MRNKITIKAPRRTQKNVLREHIQKVLKAEQCLKGVNIILADDTLLARLNERFKSKKGPTDVLSFPFEEEDFLGEVYVSLDKAVEQSQKYGAALNDEIKRLVVHGILHLLGYNHRQMPSRLKRYL
ncbi:rRNA maturation RNase YbeY [bacterium]|nr:rRNA maturation RNase YbeY [bacterium]